MPAPTHLRSLDFLRGVAILTVMLFHLLVCTYGYDHPGYHHSLLAFDIVPASWWFFAPLSFGWLGVALFFVVSGYVIHLPQAQNNTTPNWPNFMCRRFWRIYPAYFLCIMLLTWRHNVALDSREFLSHLLLINNLFNPTFFGEINSSFWSLAFEAQIYAFYPLLTFIRQKYGWRWMLPFTCAISTCWMVYAFRNAGRLPTDANIWFSPLALWPTWTLGAVIAEKHATGQHLFDAPIRWVGIATSLAMVAYVVEFVRPLGFFFAAVGVGVVVDYFVTMRQLNEPLVYRALIWLGCCSYSVYLMNQPWMSAFTRVMDGVGISAPPAKILIGAFIAIPLLIGFGHFGYIFVELRGIRFGKYLSSRLQSRNFSSAKVPT